MAYKRRSTYRRRTKRTYRRKTRRARRPSANAPKKFRLTRRETNWMTASGGGVIANELHCMDPSACTDWPSLNNLYDNYRVTCVKIRYVPHATTAQVDYSTGNFNGLYTVYDPDNLTGPTSVDMAIQYGNYRIKNMSRPWKFVIRPKVQPDNSVNNAGSLLTFYGKQPTLDVGTPNYYQRGIISWYGDNFTPGAIYGDVIIDYWIMFYNRR